MQREQRTKLALLVLGFALSCLLMYNFYSVLTPHNHIGHAFVILISAMPLVLLSRTDWLMNLYLSIIAIFVAVMMFTGVHPA